MVRSDGDPLWDFPMKTGPESLPLGERFRLSKQSAMNSRLPKVNGFTKGEATVGQVLAVGGDGECR
jgi:hypothetical protein